MHHTTTSPLDTHRKAEAREKAEGDRARAEQVRAALDAGPSIAIDAERIHVAGCPEHIRVPAFVRPHAVRPHAVRPGVDVSTVWPYGSLSSEGANHGEVCRLIRNRVKDAQRHGLLMPCKVSVRKEWATHAASISICITAVPGELDNPDYDTSADYYCVPPGERPSRYRPEVTAALEAIEAIAKMYHWDKSDTMSDYFHSRFYLSVSVGYDCKTGWTPSAWMLNPVAPSESSASPSVSGAYTIE